ncbi:MAG: hypothetical protein O2975_10125 [Proteobacteria bacterium]|nr:hypothetical protein [Pseudomonadota bacterium]
MSQPATRVVALDFLSLLLLAGAAGIAAGITLGGVALLFASQSPRAEPAQTVPGAVTEHRGPQTPRGSQVLPAVPVEVDADVLRRTL